MCNPSGQTTFQKLVITGLDYIRALFCRQ